MISMPVGFAPLLYGLISDTVGRVDKRLGRVDNSWVDKEGWGGVGWHLKPIRAGHPA
jgi:hypothetical protein